MKCKYTILSGKEFIDALVLAKECMELWESYLNELEAAHNK